MEWCIFAGNREQAFVYALTGASLTHAVAKACSAGTSVRCSCGAMSRDQPDGDFRWGGCNDDVAFAAEFSRTFTDAAWNSRKKPSKRTMTNRHNYAAGRKVVLRLHRLSSPVFVTSLFSRIFFTCPQTPCFVPNTPTNKS